MCVLPFFLQSVQDHIYDCLPVRCAHRGVHILAWIDRPRLKECVAWA